MAAAEITPTMVPLVASSLTGGGLWVRENGLFNFKAILMETISSEKA